MIQELNKIIKIKTRLRISKPSEEKAMAKILEKSWVKTFRKFLAKALKKILMRMFLS